MGRAVTKGLGSIGGVALLAIATAAVHRYWLNWTTPRIHAGDPTGIVVREWFRWFFLSLVVGRIALSCFPAGPIGSHRPRAWLLTIAVSVLLGWPLLLLERVIFRTPDTSVLLLAPWLVVLALRVATLPGAMVPRHSPRAEPPSILARALWIISGGFSIALLLLVWRWAHVGDGIELVYWLSVIVLLDHAWAIAQRAPAGRALLFALATFGIGYDWSLWWRCEFEVLFSAGACLLVPWIRRADRRSCWLAAILFASCAATHVGLACAGLATLLLTSTRAQRGEALRATVYASIVIGLPFAVVSDPSLSVAPKVLGLVLVSLVGWASLGRFDLGTNAVTRTRIAIAAQLATAVGYTSFADTKHAAWIAIALLLAGLELIPAERPDRVYETKLRST